MSPPSPASSLKTASNSVFTGIMQAIARQRLMPGTKLNEEAIGSVFGVSRTKVRSALLQLQERGLVTMQTKRTARVAKPSVKQARDVFAVRKLVEPALAAELARTATPGLIKLLRANHKEEHKARNAGDRIEATRLAGEFHVILARHGANELLAEIVERTIDQSFLITILYQAPGTPACLNEEHDALINALRERDAVSASREMMNHISAIESRMLLEEAVVPTLDIKSAFSDLV